MVEGRKGKGKGRCLDAGWAAVFFLSFHLFPFSNRCHRDTSAFQGGGPFRSSFTLLGRTSRPTIQMVVGWVLSVFVQATDRAKEAYEGEIDNCVLDDGYPTKYHLVHLCLPSPSCISIFLALPATGSGGPSSIRLMYLLSPHLVLSLSSL